MPKPVTDGPAPDHGYYLLFTDGGGGRRVAGEHTEAAIGAILKTRRLTPVGQIARTIGPVSHNVAEYTALIEGMDLAHAKGIRHLRVFMDSELVVDQVNGPSRVRSTTLRPLHLRVRELSAAFRSCRFSWVPRELNRDADRLVREALRAFVQPPGTGEGRGGR
jgi:ribonuclease HI